MDERDFQIMVALMREPTVSFEALGNEISLSGTAARNRLDRMLKEGPLVGFAGMPNAVVFGRSADVVWADAGPEARGRLEQLLEVDPVVWVSQMHTGQIAVMVYQGEDRSFHKDLEAILETPVRSSGGYAGWKGRPEEAVLSPLDWRLLFHLVRGPRMSVTRLAEKSGLTRNTAKKRRDHLYERGLLSLFPLLETARAPGLMLYNVVVDVQRQGQLNDVQQVLPNAYLIVRHDLDGLHGATFMGHTETIAGISLALEDVKRLPGVQRARLVVDVKRLFAFDRVESWVKEKIATGESRQEEP